MKTEPSETDATPDAAFYALTLSLLHWIPANDKNPAVSPQGFMIASLSPPIC